MKTKQSMKTTATSPGKPQKEEADSPAGGYRKGPWTEQEDMKLVWFVRLFGERRWDFLAKVSGLNRTGKSCRLRWVNYLHPDLKRGRMSPDEERLVVELHAKWGNRWSRIAMSMPGRTDNEIKNYWRTHMRKQDKTQRAAASGSGSAPASASTITTTTTASPATSSSSSSSNNNDKQSKDGDEEKAATAASQVQEDQLLCSGAMDHLLWNDVIDPFAWNSGPGATCVGAGSSMMVVPSSPVWDYCCSDSLWRLGDDEVAEHKKTLGTTVFVQPTRDYSMCT